jgi:hypothetical protein
LKLYNVSANIAVAIFRVNVLVGPFWKPYKADSRQQVRYDAPPIISVIYH